MLADIFLKQNLYFSPNSKFLSYEVPSNLFSTQLQLNISTLGFLNNQQIRGYLDDSQSSTGSTPSNSYFWSLGVLPVLLYHCCGSYVPVSVFNSSRSAPKGTIPFFWEHSHKNGIVLVGVLPDLLKSVKMQILGVVLTEYINLI